MIQSGGLGALAPRVPSDMYGLIDFESYWPDENRDLDYCLDSLSVGKSIFEKYYSRVKPPYRTITGRTCPACNRFNFWSERMYYRY